MEKKLFLVENNCQNSSKKGTINNNNIIDLKINTVEEKNDNTIKLQEEESNTNEVNNNKINNNLNKIENNKKSVNNPQFIVNKAVNSDAVVNGVVENDTINIVNDTISITSDTNHHYLNNCKRIGLTRYFNLVDVENGRVILLMLMKFGFCCVQNLYLEVKMTHQGMCKERSMDYAYN